MDKLSRFVTKYSKSIIIVVVLITLVLGYFAAQIKIKAGIKDMLPEDNAKVKDFEEVGDLFGGTAFAAVILEDENILDASSLKKIDEMTQKFEKIDGIEDVMSLTNVKDIKGNFFGIEVVEFVDQLPETEADIENLKEELSNNVQYMGSIVSEDFRSAVILLTFQHGIESPESVVREIREVAQAYEGPEKLHITGSPVMVTDATDAMKSDLAKLLPFVLIIVIFILWISFRSASGVILPLTTVLISVIWTIGLLSLFGKSLSLVSVVLPVLLVSVGSAYAIHIIARYYEELHAGCAVGEAVTNTIKKVGVGVLIAGATTMAGFASLFLSELKIIKEFALGTAFGVGVALFISIIFIPAIYLHLPKSKNMKAAEVRPLSARFFKRVFKLVLDHRPLIIGLAVLFTIASVFAIPKLKPETSYLKYFRKDAETRIAAEFADQAFGGSTSLDVAIFGDIKDPVLLTKMRDFQDEVEKIDGLNKPLSMVTLLREENKALNGDDESMNVIPTNQKQIAQYLLLLTMSDKDITKSLLTFDESKTRIQLRMENVPSDEMRNMIVQVQDLIDKHFGDDYKVILTGAPVMANEISDMVIASQIQSVIASVLLTFLITSLLLKSFKRGFFCSVTIGLTVLINFGIMGWFKIPLDVATAMIASVAIGIGVDYSIHIYTRYLEEKEQDVDAVEALNVAIYTVGRANMYNALAVIAGFCVILASSFPPLVNFGGLTAITMVVSFVGAVFILPTLILSTIKIAKKVKESVQLANK